MAKKRNPYSRNTYWRSLGKFVDEFANVETGMQILLWERTGTPMEIAQATFSGERIKEAMSVVRRVSEMHPLEPRIAEDQEYIFSQLNLITDLRNDILHYRATSLQSGQFLVSNWITALGEKRPHQTVVSSKTLLALARDLRKITVHLIERHLYREPGLPSPLSHLDLALLNAPWKYKPPERGRNRRKIHGNAIK